ncbi:MAG: DUF917 domain-containing protein [Alicyclobacillus sp.]|nr:DUF917 domain-containing protein [Alicyclobacillus sp.]
MMLVREHDIEALAIGAAILGAGGGGDPLIGQLMAQEAIREHGPVQLLPLEALNNHAFVLPVAMMGAPTVFLEKIPSGEEAMLAVRRMEQHLGRRADAVCPIECGGMNSMIPFVVAARLGLPVVDGDGMGRAFPELQMETFHVYGISGTPACIADEWGNVVLFETVNNFRLEAFARACTVKMGGYSHLVDYPMSGADMKRAAVPGTVSLGMALGRAVRVAQERHQDPVRAVLEATAGTAYGRGVELFRGKVVDVTRRTRDGFAFGKAVLEGLGDCRGSQLSIDFQNESLIAVRDGQVVATVPDIIAMLDPETGLPVTNERLRYGQRVAVVGIPTPPIMRTPEALKVWGPRTFGYDVDFQPLEELHVN